MQPESQGCNAKLANSRKASTTLARYHRGRTTSYPTAPIHIPARGFPAPPILQEKPASTLTAGGFWVILSSTRAAPTVLVPPRAGKSREASFIVGLQYSQVCAEVNARQDSPDLATPRRLSAGREEAPTRNGRGFLCRLSSCTLGGSSHGRFGSGGGRLSYTQ